MAEIPEKHRAGMVCAVSLDECIKPEALYQLRQLVAWGGITIVEMIE